MVRSNTLFGPWETWRRFGMAFVFVAGIILAVFVTIPIGLVALGIFVGLASVWKPLGVTDPTLGTYINGTMPFKVAQFFVAYKMRMGQVLSPMVALGFGPPTKDVDHDLEPGWTPPTRLSAYWALAAAIPLGLIDYAVNPSLLPFWKGATLPGLVSAPLSIIGWFALFQSIVAAKRIRGRAAGIIAVEPMPATMLSRVSANVQWKPVLGKSLGFGLGLAFLVFVVWMTAQWPWYIGGSLTAFALVSVFLAMISSMMSKAYREQWQHRQDRMEFWTGNLSFLRDKIPTLVTEIDLPTLEQWEQMPHAPEDPYAPKLKVATFLFAPNATFNDYLGIEDKINGALGATQSAVSPIPEVDAVTQSEISGTIGSQGFRIWWTEEMLTIPDLIDPELDDWMREFGVRSLILPVIAGIRGLGYSNLISARMMTRKKGSSANILEIKVAPPLNVSLGNFIDAIDSLSKTLSMPWIRAYSSDRGSNTSVINTVTIMMGDDPALPGVKFINPPSVVRRIIDGANWSYYFHVNKLFGGQGQNTPKYIGRRPSTPLVDEIQFQRPPGLDFFTVRGSLNSLKGDSGNTFMEIDEGTGIKPAEDDPQRDIKISEDKNKFTIIASKIDPLDRLFKFGEYGDKILSERTPGFERITWHPGVLANDTLALDDFDAAEPHLIIAGSSGSGKSVVLQNFLLQLVHNNGPEEVRLWMVEPKIGLQRFSKLDNVDKFVDSWSPDEEFYANVADLMAQGVSEMKRRNKILSRHPKQPEKLEQARRIARREGPMADGTPNPLSMPFIFIVIEECATVFTGAIGKEDQGFQAEILQNAGRLYREGRSAGIYLIALTQYPTNAALPNQFRQQSRRIGLAARDGLASKVIIDQNGLENLRIKGTGMTLQGYGYRQFRGFWLQDGDPDLGEPNDIMDIMSSIPQASGVPRAWGQQDNGLIVPDPDSAVFASWEKKTGMALDYAIAEGKKTREPVINN